MVVSSTILDGLQTAARVACKFEFASLSRLSACRSLARMRSPLLRLLSVFGSFRSRNVFDNQIQ